MIQQFNVTLLTSNWWNDIAHSKCNVAISSTYEIMRAQKEITQIKMYKNPCHFEILSIFRNA